MECINFPAIKFFFGVFMKLETDAFTKFTHRNTDY